MSDILLTSDIERVTEALSRLLVPLRTAEALDESRFIDARDALRALRPSLSAIDAVPKPLVRLLVDLYPLMDGIAGSRGPEEGQIMTWAEDLQEEIRAVLDA